MPDAFTTFSRTLRSRPDVSSFVALERLCRDVVGHRLFSCSRFQIDKDGLGTAARIHTNDEENYPTSGLKDIVPNRWTEIVLGRRETFVANSVDGFSDVFPDHALIASLGLGSVVNLPVILSGNFLGTVNLLHEPDYFRPDRLKALGQIETAAQLAFLLEQGRSAGVGRD